MTDIVERLRAIMDPNYTRVERLRAIMEPDYTRELCREAADEIERLRAIADTTDIMTEQAIKRQNVEIERLQAVIVRAKDALLDGQSTQWVHDLLVDALHD